MDLLYLSTVVFQLRRVSIHTSHHFGQKLEKKNFYYSFRLNNSSPNSQNMPTNKNHLAELIREISQQRLAVPCLTGSEPLELLLEIGLEKATKDYEFMFTESKTCSAKDLTVPPASSTDAPTAKLNIRQTLCNAAATATVIEPKSGMSMAVGRQTLVSRNAIQTITASEPVGFQNSSFMRGQVEQKLGRLAQIHLLMEHLLLIQINLKWNDSKLF